MAMWVVVIVIVCMAVVLWLVFGINWRSMRNYERRHNSLQARMMEEETESLRQLLFSERDSQRVEERFRPLAVLLTKHGRPAVSTSEQEIITTGRRKQELLIRDIMDAKESIHMEYFHFGIDSGSRQIRSLLMQKAEQGVKVRFINENIANFPIPSTYFHRMRRSGVEVVNFTNTGLSLLRFLISLSYRDHRKIVVIDGRIGYTGGMNINNHYFYQWRDTHLRLTGDAVASLQYAFLDTWFAAGGRLQQPLVSLFPMLNDSVESSGALTQITPDDPTSPEPLLQSAYEWVLDHAREYVWLQSPYLAPPDSLLQAMRGAVARGVEVRIMFPEECDTKIMRPINESYYADFLNAGVRLFSRSGEFIHSKTIIADDYLSCVGTTNLDYRSFGIDFEINTFFYDRDVAMRQKRIFEDELPRCRELTEEDLSRTSFFRRLWQMIMRRLTPIV